MLKVRSDTLGAEIDILLKLGLHPRLIQFFGSCIEGNDTLLITEFAPLGDLLSKMEKIEDTITPGHQLAIAQQICSGMEALAQIGLIHRDLALRNVLLFAYDPQDVTATSVKVSDFGLSVNAYAETAKYMEEGPKPIRWLSSEALQRGRYSEKSDVWAFGVTIWELLSNGTKPYFSISSDDAVIAYVVQGGSLGRPPGAPSTVDHLWDSVLACFAPLPANRPKFEQLGVKLGQLMV